MSPNPAAAATTTAATTTFVASEYSTGDNFQGWYLQTTPEPIVCGATETFYTSSTYGDCYDPSNSIPMATGCEGSTVLYEENLVLECETSLSCSSYKIFPTEGSDASEAIEKYGCLINWGANSVYRTLPARYDSSTAAPEMTATATQETRSATSAQTATSTNTDAVSTSNNSSDSGSGLSGGGIAGIVVGCTGAIVIIVLVVFWKRILAFFKKDKESPTDGDKPAWSEGSMPPQTQPESHTGSTWQPSEMSSDFNSVHEIGSSQHAPARPAVVHELS